ncbi:DUF5682 family protein [Streptomyces sp. S.PB5]|uniref:DUF5682 family protein n=1 Tax=Streptomyces sp. S.PB5 TaxID=3020844 RepID=UPI0025B14DF7|nr:DUF5682 family protein [Streptomyces sp. S.PB5]MDN3024533.1 DUF5682 family protein [Streptomyces sp. S.PB5]
MGRASSDAVGTEPLLLGVRHHGPGSARAVRAALDAARPRVVLIEGPPEADGLIPLAAEEDMRPPVALLAHAVDEPGRSAFWPLAEFSPEWVAIRWALEHEVPARFIDLPATHSLAWERGAADETVRERADGAVSGGTGGPGGAGAGGAGSVAVDSVAVGGPVGELAGAPASRAPDAEGTAPGVARGAEGVASEVAPGAEGVASGRPRDVGGAFLGLARDADGPAPDPARGAVGAALGPARDVDGSAPGPVRDADGAALDPARDADGRVPVSVRVADGPAPAPARDADGPAPDPACDADVRIDPLAVLADAAGYDDPERWWEDVVEHRGIGDGDAFAPFVVLEEAMGALRETYGSGGHERDLVREAYMRLQVRAAQREFGGGVAVVCGAWHVPALRRKSSVTADRALLKGLPKVKTDMTWVPWTYRRLARVSGYGAGIDSPGWYGHLFSAPDRPVERWMTKVAGLLRQEDRIVSSAHVIEAVRLAETLAAMRGRPLAGLSETTDAVRAVMCEGSDVPLALVRDRLVVGDVLGEVPRTAPAVPLQRDLDRTQRRLRLKPEALERELELDLRKETDAGRSRLLHRLRLLGVGWGEPVASRGSTGTFRETWRLRWEPELSVRIAEAGVWGTTVLAAATAKAEADAVAAPSLADVTALAERCLLAGLPDALPVVMQVLADRAALDADVGHLAQALPALVRSLRYGDVRGTDTHALTEVAAGLAERVFVGLPPACAALDTEAAEEMRRHVDSVHGAVGLLGDAGVTGRSVPEGDAVAGRPVPDGGVAARRSVPDAGAVAGGEGVGGVVPAGAVGSPHGDLRLRWRAVLRVLSGRDTVPGVIRGRAVRLLLDDGELGQDEAARLMGLVLSPGTPPADAAAWIEGFVGGGAGGGMLLVHDERLLGLVDAWLTGVPAEAFTDVLPLLRRTFSAYEPGVRRTLGELVRRGPGQRGSAADGGSGIPGFAGDLDTARADAVLPVVRLLLGLDDDGIGHGGDSGGPGGADSDQGDGDNELMGVGT